MVTLSEALEEPVDNGRLPVDNHIENQIRPIAIGQQQLGIAGSLRAGQRTAAVMNRIQSAKLKGHDPYAYLRNIQDGRAQQVPPLNEGLPMHPVQCQHCFDRPT